MSARWRWFHTEGFLWLRFLIMLVGWYKPLPGKWMRIAWSLCRNSLKLFARSRLWYFPKYLPVLSETGFYWHFICYNYNIFVSLLFWFVLFNFIKQSFGRPSAGNLLGWFSLINQSICTIYILKRLNWVKKWGVLFALLARKGIFVQMYNVDEAVAFLTINTSRVSLSVFYNLYFFYCKIKYFINFIIRFFYRNKRYILINFFNIKSTSS